MVNQFHGNPNQAEFIDTRDSPTGPALFLARPIKVNNVTCLECHSTPDKAPAEMIKLYGGDNGFGWKLDDVIGAQIVSVPVSVPVHSAENAFRVIIVWLGGAFVRHSDHREYRCSDRGSPAPQLTRKAGNQKRSRIEISTSCYRQSRFAS